MKREFLLIGVGGQAVAILLMLLISGSSFAEVYRCANGVTGETVFTDTQCPDNKSGDVVPVGRANFDSSYASQEQMVEPQQDRKGENSSRQKHAEYTPEVDRDTAQAYKTE